MKNLAGNPHCDDNIRHELTRCGIDIVEAAEPCGGEVNARLTGKLGAFTFQRAWYYWVVEGFMPLVRAEVLYENRIGRTDIRVAGHCGCPAPRDWATHYDANGAQLWSDPDGEQEREFESIRSRHEDWNWPDARFVPDAAAAAVRSGVTSYHIDSELGLYIFAKMVRDLEGLDGRTNTPSHPITEGPTR